MSNSKLVKRFAFKDRFLHVVSRRYHLLFVRRHFLGGKEYLHKHVYYDTCCLPSSLKADEAQCITIYLIMFLEEVVRKYILCRGLVQLPQSKDHLTVQKYHAISFHPLNDEGTLTYHTFSSLLPSDMTLKSKVLCFPDMYPYRVLLAFCTHYSWTPNGANEQSLSAVSHFSSGFTIVTSITSPGPFVGAAPPLPALLPPPNVESAPSVLLLSNLTAASFSYS